MINNQNQYEYVYIIDLQDINYKIKHNDLYKSIKLDKIELDIEFPDNEKYRQAKLKSVFN